MRGGARLITWPRRYFQHGVAQVDELCSITAALVSNTASRISIRPQPSCPRSVLIMAFSSSQSDLLTESEKRRWIRYIRKQLRVTLVCGAKGFSI